MAELDSARLPSMAGLVMLHGSSMTWFQTAFYCHAKLVRVQQTTRVSRKSQIHRWFVVSFEFGATVLGSMFETERCCAMVVPLPSQIHLSSAQQ